MRFNGATLSRTWKQGAENCGLGSFACFNGATLSRTWKRVVWWLAQSAIDTLQWSHAQPNVETETERSLEVVPDAEDASMEPRSAERGNSGESWRAIARSTGFNGATLSRTWKRSRSAVASSVPAAASMEPRSAERGNDVAESAASVSCWSFNGATLSRTWKHRSMIANRFATRRFNGATLSRTWKPMPYRRRDRGVAASMEPRSAERGNDSIAARAKRSSCRFNGATLSRTWKLSSAKGNCVRLFLLQWSHAQPNVETVWSRRRCATNDTASMEPRSAERGNTLDRIPIGTRQCGFNGATLSRTWKHCA